jgi:acyl-CoA thioesterase I
LKGTKTLRVCFFGDSFVNGTGDDVCLGWVGRVCSIYRERGVDLTSYNLGIRRDTSREIAQRWEAEAKARLPIGFPSRLVFSFGNNDTAQAEDGQTSRLTLMESLSNTRAILLKAKAGMPTFMIGPIPVFLEQEHNARIFQFSDAFTPLCEELEIPFLNLAALPFSFWDDWKQEAKAGDGAHPSFRGYQNLAKVISEWEPLNASLRAHSL